MKYSIIIETLLYCIAPKQNLSLLFLSLFMWLLEKTRNATLQYEPVEERRPSFGWHDWKEKTRNPKIKVESPTKDHESWLGTTTAKFLRRTSPVSQRKKHHKRWDTKYNIIQISPGHKNRTKLLSPKLPWECLALTHYTVKKLFCFLLQAPAVWKEGQKEVSSPSGWKT